jgi:hypothetical protein
MRDARSGCQVIHGNRTREKMQKTRGHEIAKKEEVKGKKK